MLARNSLRTSASRGLPQRRLAGRLGGFLRADVAGKPGGADDSPRFSEHRRLAGFDPDLALDRIRERFFHDLPLAGRITSTSSAR